MEFRRKFKILLPVILTFVLMLFFGFNFYKLKTEWETFFEITLNNEVRRVESMVRSTVESGGDPVGSLSSYIESSNLLKGAKINLYNRTVDVPGSSFNKNFVRKEIDFRDFSVVLYFDTSKEKAINTHIINQFLSGALITVILIGGVFLSLKLYFEEKETLAKEISEKERLKSISIAISSILHEVKNSLNRLNMIAYRIEAKKDFKYAKIMQKEVQQLSKFIDEAANINKPIKLNLERLNVKNLVEETLKEFAEILSLKGIKTVLEVENITINGDKKLLKEAVRNILRNAVEALDMSDKKEKKIVITVKKDKDRVKINIKDNGNIPWKEEELFLPFKTTKKKGFGIGLFTVKRTVKAHGGDIRAFKEKGYSVFEISLPITTASS